MPIAAPLPTAIIEIVNTAADRAGVERALVRAVCWIESRGMPAAKSPAGAMGLMQLMPATAETLGVSNPFDPAENATAGARFLGRLIARYGDVGTALAAYNWGPGNVQRALDAGRAWPAQVQTYVRRVLERTDAERAMEHGAAPAAPALPPAVAEVPPPRPFPELAACSVCSQPWVPPSPSRAELGAMAAAVDPADLQAARRTIVRLCEAARAAHDVATSAVLFYALELTDRVSGELTP